MNNPLLLRQAGALALAVASLVLPACATPQSRAQENPAIMQALSPKDRELALSQQIRIGMPKSAVFIAFGRPDTVVRGVSKNGEVESWIYTTTQAAYYGGFYGGWGTGFGWGPGWRRGWGGWGGGAWG